MSQHNHPWRRRLTHVVCLSMLASVFGYASTPASAASGRAQVTMPCHMTYDDGSESEGETLDFGVAMDLQVPNSVRPGQVVSPRGMLTIQVPEELRKRVEGFIDSFEGFSDTVSVGLTINGKRRVYMADRWQTGRQPAGNPMVAKAPITIGAFKVPANARGRIVLDLPRNNVIDNPYTKDGPRRVAVLARVVGRSNTAGDFPYSMACWRSDKGSAVIASIPVSTSGGSGNSGAGNSTGGGPNGGLGSTSGDSGNSGGGASDSGGALGDAAAADPFAAASDSNLSAGGGGATPMGYQTNQPADGVFVPTWLVVMVGLGAVIAASTYSAWLHLRLRALRRYSDDR